MWFQNKYQTPGKNYTIPQIDLSVPPENLDEGLRYLFTPSTVDEGQGYLGHPDSVLLKNGDILTFFPEGHGKGRTLSGNQGTVLWLWLNDTQRGAVFPLPLADRVTALQMHNVNRIEFAYDGFGRVTGRTYSNTSGANRRVTTYTYQDVGTDKTTTLLKSVNNSGFGELGYENNQWTVLWL